MAKTYIQAALFAAVATAGIFAGLTGCNTDSTRDGKAPVDMRERTALVHPALRGTIGEYSVLADSAPLTVEGYGIVADLPNTGSPDMPPSVRNYLLDELYKTGANSYSKGTEDIKPELILSSKQIAAVEVRGEIPPLARIGTRFDLTINALANTQTESLKNGILWTSILKQIGLSADTGIDTKAIALGRGPVFMAGSLEVIMEPEGEPGAGAPGATKGKAARSQRIGRVIGGGVVTVDREIRLQMFSPSHMRTASIERAVNSRFPGRDRYAQAENDAIVTLRIPPAFNSDPAYFLEVVKHMYMAQDTAGFTERKARELIAALAEPDAPHRSLSLALQGLGRSILRDYLEAAYLDPNPTVRFWSARAGAAMQDVKGLVIVQEFARDTTSPLRWEAYKSLVEVSRGADTLRATQVFADMLHSTDSNERILGYQGLVNVNARTGLLTFSVRDKFLIDVVPTDGPPLIFVTQTAQPRIAFIGRTIELPPGTLYVSPDNLLTVNVDEEAAEVPRGGTTVASAATGGANGAAEVAPRESATLYWRSPMGDRTVKLKATPNLPFLVAKLAFAPDPKEPSYDPKVPFIGISYQRVVEMLATLTKSEAIEARFMVQAGPPPIQTPADIASSYRSEKSTQEAQTQPTTQTHP